MAGVLHRQPSRGAGPTTPIVCCWLPKSHLLPRPACCGRPLASFSLRLLLSSFLHLSHPHHSLPSSSRSGFCIHSSCAFPYSPLLSLSLPQGFSHIWSYSFEPSASHMQSLLLPNKRQEWKRGKLEDKMGTPQQQGDTQVRQDTEKRNRQIRKDLGQGKIVRVRENM